MKIDIKVERRLREAGFREVRVATHGIIWTDGLTRIMTPRQSRQDPRSERNLDAEIRKALKKRAELAVG